MDAVNCSTCGSSLDFLLGGDETIFYCPTCKEVELRITEEPEGGVEDSGEESSGEESSGEESSGKEDSGEGPAFEEPPIEEPAVEELVVVEQEDAGFTCSECGRELGILRDGNAHIYYCGPCRRVDMEVDVVEDYLNRVHPEDDWEDHGDGMEFDE